MISSLTLKNFQSHVSSEFKFSKGINVIVGDNDSGKSSVIRAIKLALFNEPKNSNNYIRYTEKEFEIVLKMDSFSIKRNKGTKINQYTLDDPEVPIHEVYNSIGQNIPKLILDKTGVSKLSLDKDLHLNINILSQRDDLIYNLSSGTRSKFLSMFIGSDILDKMVRHINGSILECNSVLKIKTVDLDNLLVQSKTDKFNSIDNFKERFSKITEELTVLYEKVNNLLTLSKKLYLLQSLLTDKNKLKEAYDKFSRFNSKPHLERLEYLEKQLRLYYEFLELQDTYQLWQVKHAELSSKLLFCKNELTLKIEELNTFTVCPLCNSTDVKLNMEVLKTII